MTFLAPAALLGLLLLLLPIVVHLFKPRKMRQTPFSSLRWLKQTHQRLSRRVQWHQWLLFLLRAGCILLLVLALAKPLIGNLGPTRPTDRFLILDASRSMAYQLPDSPTPMQRATELAGEFVERARPGDRTALLVAGAPARVITPLSAEAGQYLAALKAVQPGLADSSLSATLTIVRALLPGQGERDVELVFLTDHLQQSWQQKEVQAFLRDVPRPPSIKVIDVGTGAPSNGWIADARLYQFGPDEDRWLRVEVGSVGTQIARSVRLTGIDGVADDVQAIALKTGEVGRVDFKIPAGVHLQGQVAELRLEPADALPSDDVFFLNLDTPWSVRILLVEPDHVGPDGRSAGVFVRAGIGALAAATRQTLAVTNRTATTVTADDVRAANVILLAGVPELSDTTLEALETRVRLGAGLAVFLGPYLKPAFYNQKLHRPQQPAEGLLPLTVRNGAEGFQIEGKPGTLTSVRWTHPVLAALRDPLLSDLTQARFRIYAQLDGTPGQHDTVLARFDEDMPAILEHPVGAGRVLIFNTSANDAWSDLPRRRSFIPLLDHVLSYLSAGGLQRNFTVGDSINLPLAEVPTGSDVQVQTPTGAKRTPRLLGVRGQTMLHLDDVTEAGVYRVEGTGNKHFNFVVNAGRSASPLTPMDGKALAAWWAPAPVEILSAESAREQLAEQASPWPIWPALVLLAGLLLLAETLYVYRLCPRANPKSADVIVTQRGVLRPMGKN